MRDKKFLSQMLEWWNWYTRTTQNRVPSGLRVQVPPPAPKHEAQKYT